MIEVGIKFISNTATAFESGCFRQVFLELIDIVFQCEVKFYTG